MYEFREIDGGNLWDVVELSVKDDQTNFVANNTKSLLQAAYENPQSQPRAVYHDDTLVGFLLTAENDDDPAVLWVWRYMIGADHQGKGHGRGALTQIIERMRSDGVNQAIKLSYVPTNTHAADLYRKLGFEEIGIKEDWGEMVAQLTL